MVKIECSAKDLGRTLYGDNDFTDVTLVCGDGQRLVCHRSVLAASSEFLRRLLFGSEQQQTLLFLGAMVEFVEVMALLLFAGLFGQLHILALYLNFLVLFSKV